MYEKKKKKKKERKKERIRELGRNQKVQKQTFQNTHSRRET